MPGALQETLVEHKDDGDIHKAYKDAFIKVNQSLHDDSSIDDSMSGTTAITALFQKGKVHVANVGDSRAIIGQAPPASSSPAC